MPVLKNPESSDHHDSGNGFSQLKDQISTGALAKLHLDSNSAQHLSLTRNEPLGGKAAPGDTPRITSTSEQPAGMSEYKQFLHNYNNDTTGIADMLKANSVAAIGLRATTMNFLTNPTANRYLKNLGEAGTMILFVNDALKAAAPESMNVDAAGNFSERSSLQNIAAISGDILLNVGMTKYTPKASLLSAAPLVLGLALRSGAALYPERAPHM